MTAVQSKEKWQKHLLEELPALRQAAVLDEANAGRLEEYCRNQLSSQASDSGNYLTVILAIIGSILIGLGIILFFNYNWSMLGKWQQISLSLAPLFIGFAISAYTLLKGKGRSWREFCAIWDFAANATAVGLLSQIYQCGGTLQEFALCVLITSLPLIYIFDSLGLAALYHVMLFMTLSDFSYASSSINPLKPYLSFILGFGAIPLLWHHSRNASRSISALARNILLPTAFFFVLCLNINFFTSIVPFLALLAGCFYLGGLELRSRGIVRNLSLWRLAGGLTLTVLLAICYQDTDLDLFFSRSWNEYSFSLPVPGIAYLLAAGCFIWYFIRSWKARHLDSLKIFIAVLMGVFILTPHFCFLFPPLFWLAFNLLGVIWGILLLRSGFMNLHSYDINAGLLQFTVLVAVHFFSDNFGLLARALAFIVAGVLFILANALLSRRKRKRILQNASPATLAQEEQK